MAGTTPGVAVATAFPGAGTGFQILEEQVSSSRGIPEPACRRGYAAKAALLLHSAVIGKPKNYRLHEGRVREGLPLGL